MTAGRAVLTRNVAPGVHRLAFAGVNLHLLEDRGALTVVDAGLPRAWRHLQRALEVLGREPRDVRALVLTHAHFDHVGTARRMQDAWGVRIMAHPAERRLAAHPYSYAHEDPRLLVPLVHPRGLPVLAAMVAGGALAVRGVEGIEAVEPGQELDVPGSPLVVFSPGHTAGHCALSLRSAGALITGDALVTLDPYTGGTGPRIVSGAATADTAEALRSLDALAATDARPVLPGHGVPWRGGVRAAAAAARAAGRPR